ncbi:ribonuclease HII [Haloechinothrix sp. LS1_15]|uniref:ribonuclease HII n=1 Tax=Haloechinothrix sp. LS1_15 TaxID=2652248 RepID=UPI002946C410|nr:ribonuclease HII [Haloechinothrix sp. LS1_15]MDV6012804.1 ribonuclease HII [Haloechinothrix sp. LS1_15]
MPAGATVTRAAGIPRPARVPVRRDGGSWAMQRALTRRGLGPVAGVDEAGRGACAGPLVVAACVLHHDSRARFPELTDSKRLNPAVRERLYGELVAGAETYAVVVIDAVEIDLDGVHAANIAGMRRAVARLRPHPGYVLLDGFAVHGLASPSLPVVRGDRTAACVAAASVLAKVTRDRIMTELHEHYPQYGFAGHKGYGTAEHTRALAEYGPSEIHRWSYANVAAAARDGGSWRGALSRFRHGAEQ